MEVEATIESPLVFAGDRIVMTVEFIPPSADSGRPIPVLLSGYAAVQGSFRLGEMILSEPFAETRKAGTVLTKRGFDYGQPQSSGGLFANVLDGLKHFVVTNAANSGSNGSQPGGTSVSGGIHSSRGDEGEYPIFATSQLLLFTDLKLESSQPSHKFSFSVDMPATLPPTYRSRSLHITYNLVVGFERLKLDSNGDTMGIGPHDTRLFLPFRLLAKPPTALSPIPLKFDLREPYNAGPPQLLDEGKSTDHKSRASSRSDENDEDLDSNENENMDTFVQNLLDGEIVNEQLSRNRRNSIAQIPGAQYTKVSYEINRGRTPIAQLALARPAISVGDVLAAQIRFKRPCLHLSVYLELEEIIDEQYAALGGAHVHLTKQSGPRSPNLSNSDNNNNSSNDSDNATLLNHSRNSSDPESPALTATNTAPTTPEEVVATTYTIYGRQFQGVYGISELPLFLPTLTSVTPRLDTEQICASWTLRLEFVGLAGAAFSDDDDNELLAKGQIDHETFTCRIPVVILPPMSGGIGASKTWRF